MRFFIHKLTVCAILFCCRYSQAGPPPTPNLASQIVVRFADHMEKSAALRTHAKGQDDIALTDKLKTDAKVCAHIAMASLTSIDLYTNIQGEKRGPALESLKVYLGFAFDELGDRIGSCGWVSARSKRPEVIVEAEKLQSDLKRFAEYLGLFRNLQPSDVLPQSLDRAGTPVL